MQYDIKNGLKHYSLKPFFGIITYFLDVYALNATALFFYFCIENVV